MVYNLDQNSINKIIDIFKDIYLFQSFQYFDLKTEQEKAYFYRNKKIDTTSENFLFFKEKINNEEYNKNFLIDNLNSICNLQKKNFLKEDGYKCSFLLFGSNIKKKTYKKISIGGLNGNEPSCDICDLEDQTFFILSFLFCMLNEGTKKNEDTESFTLDFFKEETKRIEKILKELIDNEEEIKKLETVIKEIENIENKETLKKILEPFFQKEINNPKEKEENPNKKEEKESNLKFYLGILFVIILILLIFQKFLKK